MSQRLPALNAREVERALAALGFEFHHQEGSHAVYKRAMDGKRIVVAKHGARSIPRGTLRAIIRQTGAPVEEFIANAR
ncbi:MAG: addiction module toxin, HicA family [Planctomycetes bacterium]|nr:addiction module toxin, HicA family [Planctomycetota bacterium]